MCSIVALYSYLGEKVAQVLICFLQSFHTRFKLLSQFFINVVQHTLLLLRGF